MLYTHRVAAIVYFDFDPTSGFYVLHHCDNRSCCNPSHLYIGTHQDNMRDKAVRGRAGKKLTREDVGEIKTLLAEGHTQAEIAARYHVSKATISQIWRGKIWNHVEPAAPEE